MPINFVTFASLGKFGRVGNSLFQVAAVLGYSIKHGVTPIFPKWYCDYTKKDMSVYFKNPVIQELQPYMIKNFYEEPFYHYSEIPVLESVSLHGYYQSEKYFENCRWLIEHHFEPARWVIDKFKDKYWTWLNTNCCAIHVRRGDYVGNAYHEVCDIDYYNRAIELIKSKTTIDNFVVFSDDIAWCKENFPKEFIFIEGNTDIEDLFLGGFCKHVIGCNSSFSWWMFNLDQMRLGIFPDRWFGESAGINDNDVYTNNMIRIN